MRTLLTLLCVALLSGCVTTRQYQWGSYENDLYAAYKDPARSERLMEGLQSLISELEASKQKVPPGIMPSWARFTTNLENSTTPAHFMKRSDPPGPKAKG